MADKLTDAHKALLDRIIALAPNATADRTLVLAEALAWLQAPKQAHAGGPKAKA